MDELPLFGKTYTKSYLKDCNILSLSFVGDAIHTFYIRDRVFSISPYKNNELHKDASSFCKAEAQAKLTEKLYEMLDEDEIFIYKKAKHSRVNSIPKNCDAYTYHLATAFEAVIGYIYLLGNQNRVLELLNALYIDDKNN